MQSAAVDTNDEQPSPVAFFVHLQDEVSGRSGSTQFTGALEDMASSRGVVLPWGMGPGFVVASVHQSFIWARETRHYDLTGFFSVFGVPRDSHINQVMVDDFIRRLETSRGRGFTDLDSNSRTQLAVVAIMTVARRWLGYCRQQVSVQAEALVPVQPTAEMGASA